MDTHEGGEEQKTESREPGTRNSFAIPTSIVIAGLLVALAVLYTGKNGGGNAGTANVGGGLPQVAADMRPVSGEDHIYGNPDAPVKIVEYSDLECPYCKVFHSTMERIMAEYGGDGKVAWVYRHLPLDSLHPKARKEAVATECAFLLGGNEKFWAYTNTIFRSTPSNNQLDHALLPKFAEDIGLNRDEFVRCLDEEPLDIMARIDKDMLDAETAGARGTPYSILITPKGNKVAIPGAQPYTDVKAAIDTALAEK